jgi:hypothetical protein
MLMPTDRRSRDKRASRGARLSSNFSDLETARFERNPVITYILAQPQSLPQLQALPLFIGQFLPVLLQFGLSAAKETVHSPATKIENSIFV